MATTGHVALLRGVNVGGKNLLPMKELAALFEAAGAAEVSTYLQSGNVIFQAEAKSAARLAATLAKEIRAGFGLEVPVIVRSAAELAEIVERNPFRPRGKDPTTLHVVFLAEVPAKEGLAMLDPDRSPGDRFEVVGREIYLHCPKGYGQSKLTNQWFDSRLGTLSTVRNWRTVQKLLELASR